MRTRYIILLTSACLLLLACRTSRNTEQQVERDYSKELGWLSAQMDSLRAGFRVTQRQVTDKLSSLKVEHTATYYTLPDSAGKQYPVYVSTIKADKDEQATERTYTELDAAIRRLETAVDSLSAKVYEALKEEQKAAELSWWDLHKGKVMGGGMALALVVIGWLVYRMRRR